MSESLLWTPRGEFFEGTHYILSGGDNARKPLVVCVHGIDGYHYTFDNLAKLLSSEGYRVLQYDLIGRGFSAPHKSKLYGIIQHLDQLHNLLVHLKEITTPYHLIGLSMGGSLATIYASHYIEEVRSLTLLAPAGLMKLPNVELLRQCPCFQTFVRYPIQAAGNHQPWSKTFYKHDGV